MSYQMMEAMLVQRIAELHASEAAVQRSLDHLQSWPSADVEKSLQREFDNIQARLVNVEQLLSLMESSSSANESSANFLPTSALSASRSQVIWS